MASGTAKGIAKTIGAGVVSLLVAALMLVMMEGAASWALIIADVEFSPTSTNEYDADLGWISKRSATLPDFYGPGRSVVSNAEGFRSDVEFAPTLAEGAQRIVCSGDSFTFGAGVGNGETWCDLLTAGKSRDESVILGVSGYGIGQSMLRYEKQTHELEHTLHVFAFIASDIPRATAAAHNGYGRPVVQVTDGTLSVENVPVPRRLHSLARNTKRVADAMRAVEAAKRLRRSFAGEPPPWDRAGQVVAVSPVAREIFLRVRASTAERGARPVFVFLPTLGEYAPPKEWEKWLTEAMPGMGLTFINLTPDLREVHEDLIASYFIPVGQPGETHYTRVGHRWLAATLRRHLISANLLPDAP